MIEPSTGDGSSHIDFSGLVILSEILPVAGSIRDILQTRTECS